MSYRSKLAYFLSSAAGQIQRLPIACPNCRGSRAKFLDRKFLVTSLHECEACGLLFRYPPDRAESLRSFYEHEYEEGETTALPRGAMLQKLLSEGFARHDRSHDTYIEVLRALGGRPGYKLIDFGCSWGYGAWQLQRAGYEVTGLEVASGRAAYGINELGLRIVSKESDLPSDVDLFFSSHVLEHLPAPAPVLQVARRKLRRGGLFVAFTPNGSALHRNRAPQAFHRLWGQVHPVLLTDRFCTNLTSGAPRLMASSPYDLNAIAAWDRQSSLDLDTSGDELLLVVAVEDT